MESIRTAMLNLTVYNTGASECGFTRCSRAGVETRQSAESADRMQLELSESGPSGHGPSRAAPPAATPQSPPARLCESPGSAARLSGSESCHLG